MLLLRVTRGPDAGQEHAITRQLSCAIGNAVRRKGDFRLSDPALGADGVEIMQLGIEYRLDVARCPSPVTLRQQGRPLPLNRHTRNIALHRGDEIEIGATTFLVVEMTTDRIIVVIRGKKGIEKVVYPDVSLPPADLPELVAPPEVVASLVEFSAHLPFCETTEQVQVLILRSLLRAFPATTHAAIATVQAQGEGVLIEPSWAIAREASTGPPAPFEINAEVVKKTIEHGDVLPFTEDYEQDGHWVRSVMAAPLRDRKKRILGILEAEIRSAQPQPDYSKESVELFRMFASHAAHVLGLRVAEEMLETERAIKERFAPIADAWHTTNNLLQSLYSAVGRMKDEVRTIDIAELQRQIEEYRKDPTASGPPLGTFFQGLRERLEGGLGEIRAYQGELENYRRSIDLVAGKTFAPAIAQRSAVLGLLQEVCTTRRDFSRYEGLPVDIVLRVTPGWETVYVDLHHVRCIATNLLMNAFRAIKTLREETRASLGAAGRIDVLLSVRPDIDGLGFDLYVRDTGCGMSQRQQGQFLEMGRPKDGQGEGLGLGRILIRLILRWWNGAMQFGTVLGRGTVFKCALRTGRSEEEHQRLCASVLQDARAEVSPSSWEALCAELEQRSDGTEPILFPGTAEVSS